MKIDPKWNAWGAALGACMLSMSVQAAPADAAMLANACAGCHGTNGGSAGLTMPSLAGQSKEAIEVAMKKHHKPDDSLCKKIAGGTGSDADLAAMLKVYQDMCAAMPPKGDKAAWVAKCQSVIGAVKKIQAKDPSGVAAFKTASDCKACHKDHK